MRFLLHLPALCAAAVATAHAADVPAPNARLTVRIEHVFGGEPLRFDDLTLAPKAGGKISVTRLAYLITEFALLQPDGKALRADGQAAFMDAAAGRVTFTLPGVPRGDYAGVAFRVGVPKDLNHREPAAFAPGEALNPAVNGLHWSWQGGFVFLALEGRYAKPEGAPGGYSYHLARDENLMTVRLEGDWKCAGDTEVVLRCDVARVLDGIAMPTPDGADSTHSAPGDALAVQLKKNVEGAFAFARVGAAQADGAILVAAPIVRGEQTTPFTLRVPFGFPQPQLPADNPLTVEGVALGARLFADARLSADNTQSCATCHDPAHAFASAERVSRGIDGLPGTRNAPSLFNLAWQSAFAWDGRRARLRDQVLAPIADEREMHQPLERAVEKLRADASYPAEFARAFGSTEITAAHAGLALEQFLLTRVTGDAKFDRVARGEAEFTAEEKRGFELFGMEFDPRLGRRGADCFHCHGGYAFSDYAFHNIGLATDDPGRGAVTGRVGDRAKFKTPSLRNVALTAPYMHDGRFATLAEVVAHYDHGVVPGATLDPNIAKHPSAGLGLSDADQRALIAFLEALTDDALRPAAETK